MHTNQLYFGTFLAITLLIGCESKKVGEQTSVPTQVGVVELSTKLGSPMVLIPAGDFDMGSSSGDETPIHRVKISSFVIDKYEVTQDLLEKMQVPDPSHFKDPKRPVEMVRWSEAALLCNERSKAEGLKPCYDEVTFACDYEANGYRLPTEAEWEYAATSGGKEAKNADGSIADLDRFAVYSGNSGERTSIVGQKRANQFGLFDMLGNVAEWCQDPYAADYYSKSPAQDPRGPESGEKRVLRGGSWKTTDQLCRLTARMSDNPGINDACFAQDSFGFRCVRKPSPDELAKLNAKQPTP